MLVPDPSRQNDRILAPVSLAKVSEFGKTAGSKWCPGLEYLTANVSLFSDLRALLLTTYIFFKIGSGHLWEVVQHGCSIGSSMMVRRAWTFTSQSFRRASYPLTWNINGQQTLRISPKWTFHFGIKQLVTQEKSNQKAWKTWNVLSKTLQLIWIKKLSGRCVDTPERKLLFVCLLAAAFLNI